VSLDIGGAIAGAKKRAVLGNVVAGGGTLAGGTAGAVIGAAAGLATAIGHTFVGEPLWNRLRGKQLIFFGIVLN